MSARTVAVVVVSLASLAGGVLSAADPPITSAEARERVGKRATVCGEVVSVIQMAAPRAGGEQLFLHFDEPPPNSPFIVGIIGTELINRAFRGIAKTVEHKTVCATGHIKMKGTTPLMVVTGPNQLKITDASQR
jgi:hypothetical protein